MRGDLGARRNRYDRLRTLRRLARPIEAAQVRVLGGSALSVLLRTPVLVLITTGRRSGAARSTTLAYHRLDAGNLVVVAGAGGQRRLPDWVANLRADGSAAMVVRRTRFDVRAAELLGDDRVATWNELRRVWPQIDTYERRAGRDVPVFRLRKV
ncbi:MAG: nitroreductase/quinone reductase family protein [Acidimicrobiales bacterium]